MHQGNAIRHVVRATVNSAPCASDLIRPILIVPAQSINNVAPLPGMDEIMSQWLQRCEGIGPPLNLLNARADIPLGSMTNADGSRSFATQIKDARPPISADETISSTTRTYDAEHLLYSRAAIKLPARSRVAVYIRLPHVLDDKSGAAVVVDRLPYKPGLDEPHMVECSCESPTDDHVVRVII